MIRAGMGRLFGLILLAIFTSTGATYAQSTAGQNAKEPPTPPQSTIQIVNPDQKPFEPKSLSTVPVTPLTQKPAEPKMQIDSQPMVLPPAPVIVKKSPNAISIPVDGANQSKPESESTFEQRPAVSSGVSVGSVYGYRRDPFTRRARFHSGVDIKARWGDAVGASQAGTVQFAGWYHGYGNLIIINHGGGVATHYAHLSSFDVEVGTHVERGTIIGRAGSTGRATSPHLHYEVRIDGSPMNPFQPLALDPSSDYFKAARPPVDAGRVVGPSAAMTQRDN